MKAFMISVCLAALLGGGLAIGYFLRQESARDRIAQAEAAAAEARDAEARAKARPPAPAPVAAATTPAPAATVASTTPADDEDDEDEDDEEAYIRDAMAKRVLMDNCQVCHAPEMFESQRLTETQWRAEVDKMVGWGAALTEPERPQVVEYLAKHYGADVAPEAPPRATLAEVDARETPGDPHEGTTDADLANGAKFFTVVCANCHGPTALGGDLGPGLANRAPISHVEYFNKVLHDGLRKMPSMTAVLSPEQQRDILGWLRSLPYDQPDVPPAAAPAAAAPKS